MPAFVDTNILVRHLTQDPPNLGQRATKFLGDATELLLTDVIVAETVYVLQSFYNQPRPQIAVAVRALLAFEAIRVADDDLLMRCIDLYEFKKLHFADAYLAALAELSGVGEVASFDSDLDGLETVRRIAP